MAIDNVPRENAGHMMSLLGTIAGLLRNGGLSDNPDLLRAQHRAFVRQVPLMYVILGTSTWTLAITHMPYAPLSLTVGAPVLMTFVSILRVIGWWRHRNATPSIDRVRTELRRTLSLTFFMASAFSAWALALFGYGTAHTQAHVAFYMAITVISCIFCLMHLRPAAIIVAVIVNGLFVCFFLGSGEPTFMASSINVVLVSVAILIILNVNYRNFTHMVEARAKAVALSNDNFRLANLDSLTDLPNRRAFFAELEGVFPRLSADEHVAVGILDLDGFKPVNDAYGHGVGDRLLQEVGRRLEALCHRHRVFVARLGGDEFAFLLTAQRSEDACRAWGQELCADLARPIELVGTVVPISGSLGIAATMGQATSPQELMHRADYALYEAKRGQRGTVVLFSEAHGDEIRRHVALEQALRSADLEQELRVVFQPIVDLHTGRPIGFEALARWASSTLGIVSPGEFIPAAERGAFVSRLTPILLGKALAAARHWPNHLRLSFNLSAQDLNCPLSIPKIAAVIIRSGFDPRRLDLEITETALASDPVRVKQGVQRLREFGCGIAIDDFGTGYSSLSRLHSLPLTKLKIDRSFVTRIEDDPASRNIVKSLVALSRDMGLDCIIEGVETREELAVVRQLGGALVQGYVFSAPMDETRIADYLGHGAEPQRAAGA